MPTRRSFLASIAASAALAGCSHSASRASKAPAKPANIVFLFSDDQRFDTIRALGNPHIHTPNLDRLARRSCCFDRAYIMGGTHGAVCVASRSMVLTGRNLFRSPDQPPPAMPLWPQVLRDAGYATFLAGKWHNGAPSIGRCFTAGDNIFLGGMSDQSRVAVQSFDPAGRYPKARQRIGDKFSSELFADSAVHFLREHPANTRYAMWCAFTSPHDPRTPPGRFATMYDPAKLPLPANFLAQHPFDNGEMVVRDEKLAPTPRDPAVIRQHLADYYGMISHLDEQIGRILDAIDRRPDADNTVIIFAGDNGLAIGSHGLLGKQNLYEHSIRVPLMLAGPNIAPSRCQSPVYLLDIYPTALESAGMTPPDGIDGRALYQSIAGNGLRSSMLFAYRHFQRAVSDGRYKLIRYTVNRTVTTQLFDLKKDPNELHDLSTDPAHKAHFARLQNLLAEQQNRLSDPTTRPSARA